MVRQWLCPEECEVIAAEADVRVGGAFHESMRCNGKVYTVRGVYREIKAGERLVFTHRWDDGSAPETLVRVELRERDGRTELTLTQSGFETDASAHDHTEGWSSAMAHLARVLADGAGDRVSLLEGADADREIVLTRIVNARRELVWQVWTQPEHTARWWGPQGFTTTTKSMELRPGGQWRYVMHGPDGRDYENLVTYEEVVPNERLVYKHGGDVDCEPVNFRVRATFERFGAGGEQTRLTLRMMFPTQHARDVVVREYGAIEGGKQTLGRLAEYLAAQDGGGDGASGRFSLTRVLRAPRALVYRTWTERDHLAQWFGPKGWTIPICSLDLRPGGSFHYCMRMAGAPDMWGKWSFREIVPSEKLVFVSSFSDESGKVIAPPFADPWPPEMLVVVTFNDHAGIGRGTVVTIRSEAFNATDAQRRTFIAGFGSMKGGWSGTFDVLERYLASLE